MRLGGYIGNGADLEASSLEGTDCGLATGSRSLDEDVNLLDTVLLRLTGSALSSKLSGEGSRLTRTLEADVSRRRPGNDISGGSVMDTMVLLKVLLM